MTESPKRRAGVGRSGVRALQRIGRGTVSNLTPFGRALRRHAISELDWFARDFDFGFLDGGCRMFAQGLIDWSGGDLRMRAVVRIGETRIQHYVASDGLINLDADGAGCDDDMVRKMAMTEDCPNCQVRGDMPLLNGVEVPYDASATARITTGLIAGMGPWPGMEIMADLRDGKRETASWNS